MSAPASRPLSDAEVSLLEKGLNFAVTSTNIPATEIVAKVESAIRTLDSEQADTVRRSVNNILQQAEPPKPNITEEMQEALKNLKQDDSIMILPADKGRASVVLNADTYHDKMKTLIEKRFPNYFQFFHFADFTQDTLFFFSFGGGEKSKPRFC